jgi:hypothetical protein
MVHTLKNIVTYQIILRQLFRKFETILLRSEHCLNLLDYCDANKGLPIALFNTLTEKKLRTKEIHAIYHTVAPLNIICSRVFILQTD